MKIKLRIIGNNEIAELTVDDGYGSFLTSTVESLKDGLIPEEIISNLKDIADQMDEFNQNVAKQIP